MSTPQQKVDRVAGRSVTLRKQVHDQLTAPGVIKQIERMAPQGSMVGEQFVRVVLSEIGRNEAILQCSPRSIIRACYEAAALGLMINGVLGHAYLVPYLGKTKAAQLIVGYRGLVELAMRSGKLRHIGGELIHQNDTLIFRKGTDAFFRHEYELGADRGERVGAYAIAHLTTGGQPFELMDVNQIYEHRDKSSGWRAYEAKKIRDTPWADDLASEWMWRKTPLRALCKVLPLSPVLQQVAVADELRDQGINPAAPYTERHDEIIDVSGDEPPQPEPAPEPEREPGQEG